MSEEKTTYSTLIRDNATGEERMCAEGLDYRGNMFVWTQRQGNFGCDCNRYIFFCEAGNDEEDPNFPCGYDRYTAIKAVLSDGREIMIDGQKET